MLPGTRNWQPLAKEPFAALQRGLVAAPQWVIDGNYASSMPIRLEAADTVIFLDLPARACLWGIAQRRLRHRGGQHGAIGVVVLRSRRAARRFLAAVVHEQQRTLTRLARLEKVTDPNRRSQLRLRNVVDQAASGRAQTRPFGTADGSWLMIIQGTPIRSICALASSGSGR